MFLEIKLFLSLHKGNNPILVRYQVNYCSINKPCDRVTEKSASTSVLLKNLTPRHIYQFTVRVFNENDDSDAERSTYTYIFKTSFKGEWICMEIIELPMKNRYPICLLLS